MSTPILDAARTIRQICAEQQLEILAFASFQNFEGQQSPLQHRLQKAKEWLSVAHALGAAHLQVPSNFDRSADGDRNTIASDLRRLCDSAATFKPVIKIAYENLAWATHCHLWQHALQTAQAVDRDNFGLCLDSFHLRVALWADPFSAHGVQPNGDRGLADSLREPVQRLPREELFYLQLSDGERWDPVYSRQHPWFDAGLEPGHVWSNEARPFPLETEYGGYMPVVDVARAFLVDLGYTGWVSLETFDRRMRAEEQGPVQSAQRAARSWRALETRLSDTDVVSSKL